ncbi:MAG: glycine cleavage system protein H [Cuniculiplasma sp. C_DKE]|jgi:glycine cleavage system H protein|uniref:Probable glycine cleavage system H protein n=1 Tax=Cuniculiplasma divulgatum TaxID=1673428 RepID=A0A1R4A5N9_9ARCH|nr:glycine cleavage system protein GcvH [Cuniculiplasma divulgatum]EQB69077.1 MAG: glycine cleavage system protein H [Thermoplasmatales archaeon Gpl]MCI2412230.1 glycine cleavage system protein GcvH [Cuniculiplasma sp.]OWP54847.1 MAG: glycine cleavage system protein H [Cuniculiplasma sp. C_DKE]WMT48625.1 MAG: glycine cleavage system protein GcvH [Thermoplasmatales archaeon]SJK84281.1 glycine cleavage system H protein (lipoate-binding) [Cuniculiplasma divulgatum]
MSNIPEDLKYTKTHEWVRTNGTEVEIGVTDFAQKQLTDVVYVDLPEVGKEIKSGDTLLTVESVKSAEEVFSPVTGKITAVNKELESKPELINQEPYNSWLVKIKLSEEIKGTLTAEEYRKLTGQ